MAKNHNTRFKTPRGVAIWPSLHKADTKFNADGTYKTELLLDPEDPKVAELIETIKAEVDAIYQTSVEELKAKGGKGIAASKKLQKALPFEPQYDDDGNETGMLIFKFKLNRVVRSKKTGKTYTFEPKIFDARTKPMNPVPPIYNGSELKINGEIRPYFMPSTDSCGVTLQISQVQVLHLVSGGAGVPDFDEEDGYEYDESDVPSFDEDESTDGEGDDESTESGAPNPNF